MSNNQSFGAWLRQRRRALDLTQEELAQQVGCSAITLRKLEAEERKPSKQIAERLAEVLHITLDDQPAFLRFARGDPFAAPSTPLTEPAQPVEQTPNRSDNLPIQLTSFIGREKELAAVARLLTSTRLLTLTGSGGTGKTRLSLQVAAAMLNEFPDGVWWVQLAPLADPELVPQIVATTLDLREVPGRPIQCTLVDHLRPKQLLLVLDNCEHLVEACAQLSGVLLQACPKLRVLATSREALSIAGETVFQVPSLSLPEPNQLNTFETLAQSESIRLFIDRARAVLPNFRLTELNAASLSQICRQLDGIPLALELAAARVRLLTVEQIAARLDDRFRLLTGGSRTALPRHQTLTALIDWSYDLLAASERVLLQRLSVFAGGWTLEAAEAVASGPDLETGAVLDLLAQLTNKSLVSTGRAQGAEARFRLLETIRQYALEKLTASGELDALRRRHADYYLALVRANESLSSSIPPAVWERLETEHDNLRAVLNWSQSTVGDATLGLRLAIRICPFWGGHGYLREGYDRLESALMHAERAGVLDKELQARALAGLGIFSTLQNDFTAAQEPLDHALRLWREIGNIQEITFVLYWLGYLAREQGDSATARLRLEESLAFCRELGDKFEIADGLVTLGQVAVMQEDVAWATLLLEEGLTLMRALGVGYGIGWALNHLGHVAQLQGQYEQATQLHHESLPFFRADSQNPRNRSILEAFEALGETALGQGNASLAAPHFTAALTEYRAFGDKKGLVWCLAGLAGVAALDEEPERAAQLWGAAEALRLSIGSRHAPASRATRERLVAEAREELGEAAFESAWARGQALTLEQAIELALEGE
jgi:predicted ATPase/DNA-binding XRE family transcriptional regulator